MQAPYITKAMVLPTSVVLMKRSGRFRKRARMRADSEEGSSCSFICSLSAAKKAVSIPEKKAEKANALRMAMSMKGDALVALFLIHVLSDHAPDVKKGKYG